MISRQEVIMFKDKCLKLTGERIVFIKGCVLRHNSIDCAGTC